MPKGIDRARHRTSSQITRRFVTVQRLRSYRGEGLLQAYNRQVAVDADSHVIVAQLTSNNATDQIQLKPIVAQTKDSTGRQARELSTDAGYCTAHNLLKRADARA